MKCLETNADTTVTITTLDREVTFPLYSNDAVEYLSSIWLKLAAQNRLMYEVRWMGVPFIQLAEDLAMMHELVWTLRPDLIIECGIGQGGGLLFYSSMLHLIGHGRVVGVDVEIRESNRARIEESLFHERIELLEGSSTDSIILETLHEKAQGLSNVLVILDSDHTMGHVARELDLYHPLVTPGSYLVVMDGGAAHVWDIPRDQSKYRDNHPLLAIEAFLERHPEFQMDPHYNRLGITSSPQGFLRRSNTEK